MWPAYLAMGMPYDEYWHGPAELTRFWREAENIKLSKQNQKMWLMGQYFYAGISASIARQINGDRQAEYPNEPLTLAHERREKIERERQRAIAFFNSFAARHQKNKDAGGG